MVSRKKVAQASSLCHFWAHADSKDRPFYREGIRKSEPPGKMRSQAGFSNLLILARPP